MWKPLNSLSTARQLANYNTIAIHTYFKTFMPVLTEALSFLILGPYYTGSAQCFGKHNIELQQLHTEEQFQTGF